MEKVKINDISIKKLYNYVQTVDNECGGFIIGERDVNNKTYKITDIVFLKLAVSRGMDFAIDDEAIFEFMQKSPELSSKVIGWWHTHPSFNTFFSGIDENTFKVLNSLFKLPIGVVINKMNEWYWAYMDNIKGIPGLIDLTDIEASTSKKLYKMDKKLISEAKNKIQGAHKTFFKRDIKNVDGILYEDLEENIKPEKSEKPEKIVSSEVNEFFTLPINKKVFSKIIKEKHLSKGDNFYIGKIMYEVL